MVQLRSLLDALIAARKDAGLTQAALADKLLVAQSFVARYEHGERGLKLEEFLRIVDILNVDIVAFFQSVDAGGTNDG